MTRRLKPERYSSTKERDTMKTNAVMLQTISNAGQVGARANEVRKGERVHAFPADNLPASSWIKFWVTTEDGREQGAGAADLRLDPPPPFPEYVPAPHKARNSDPYQPRKGERALSEASSARGADMGRADDLPDDPSAPIKLHLYALRMCELAYDIGGAYWGMWSRTQGGMYHAYADQDDGSTVNVFVRARNRDEAQSFVRAKLPGATFYRCPADYRGY